MSARGKTEIQFGSGETTASVFVSAPAIEASDVPQAWVMYRATTMTDNAHSADEHLVDAPRVYASEPTAGSGFTIYAVTSGDALTSGNWSVGWAY